MELAEIYAKMLFGTYYKYGLLRSIVYKLIWVNSMTNLECIELVLNIPI